jgi:glucan phosphoethanolaminetransferase (alkaline phosphatase superfamily)
MRVTNFIVALILIIFYIALFIPLILPHLNQMFIDWINNSGNMFIQQYCTQRQVLVNNTFVTTTECTQFDFRPLIVFLYQLTVYFVLPLVLILTVIRRR